MSEPLFQPPSPHPPSPLLDGVARPPESLDASRLVQTPRRPRTLVDFAPVGLVVVSDQGFIQSINPYGAGIFGFLPAELGGQPLTKILPSLELERFSRQPSVLSAPTPLDTPIPWIGRAKDQTARVIALTLRPLVRAGDFVWVGVLQEPPKRPSKKPRPLKIEAASGGVPELDHSLTLLCQELCPRLTALLGLTNALLEGRTTSEAHHRLELVRENSLQLREVLFDLAERVPRSLAEPSRPDEREPDPLPPPGEDFPALRSSRILIIEDAPATQQLLQFHLTQAQADVRASDKGPAAILEVVQAIQREQPYDLIFLELDSPSLNGLELLHRLRSAGFHQPIVALTGAGWWENQEHHLDTGFDDYAIQPLAKDELLILADFWIRQPPGNHPIVPLRTHVTA